MKMILATLVLAASTTVFAQAKKMSPPPARPANTTISSTPSYASSSPQGEITANLGMASGAFNIGATYVKSMGDFGFGGYLFHQSGKDKNGAPVVVAVTAIGALIKVTVYENSSVRAYMAPGAGLAMLKDASIDATGKKSDETIIGPSLKLGVQYKTAGNLVIGLERMEISNWFNDSVNAPGPVYSVAASFAF